MVKAYTTQEEFVNFIYPLELHDIPKSLSVADLNSVLGFFLINLTIVLQSAKLISSSPKPKFLRNKRIYQG